MGVVRRAKRRRGIFRAVFCLGEGRRGDKRLLSPMRSWKRQLTFTPPLSLGLQRPFSRSASISVTSSLLKTSVLQAALFSLRSPSCRLGHFFSHALAFFLSCHATTASLPSATAFVNTICLCLSALYGLFKTISITLWWKGAVKQKAAALLLYGGLPLELHKDMLLTSQGFFCLLPASVNPGQGQGLSSLSREPHTLLSQGIRRHPYVSGVI